jgi:hydrogenase-1 operon protein HyaF
MTGRPNPFVWTGEQEPQGVFVGAGGDDGLRLLGLPQGMRKRDGLRREGAMSPRVMDILSECVNVLRQSAQDGASRRIAIDHLSPPERDALFDALGDGEETALIATEKGLVQASEAIFTGVWIVRSDGADDDAHLEIADVPGLAREMALATPLTHLPLETIVPPDGTMNVMGVLAEVRHLAQTWKAGDANHVINFTLLPMTEADADFLAAILGQGAVRFSSGGYGSARVIATALRRVWAVQYVNSMGVIILDTLEIGDVPDAARACPEDFEDSARRIDTMLAGAMS